MISSDARLTIGVHGRLWRPEAPEEEIAGGSQRLIGRSTTETDRAPEFEISAVASTTQRMPEARERRREVRFPDGFSRRILTR